MFIVNHSLEDTNNLFHYISDYWYSVIGRLLHPLVPNKKVVYQMTILL